MKKIIIPLLALLLTTAATAQSVQIDRNEFYRLDTFNITTTDTSWMVGYTTTFSRYQTPLYGSIAVTWSGLTGTLDGTLKLQASSDSLITWTDMNYSAAPMATAAGQAIFKIPEYDAADFDGVRVYFTRNSITGGKIIPSMRLYKPAR